MLRKFTPKSLYARVALIVILPIFIMQSAVTYAFFERHWDAVTANLSRTTAGQIALLIHLFEEAEGEEARKELFQSAVDNMDISIRYAPDEAVPQNNKLSVLSLYDDEFQRRLRDKINRPYWLNTQSWPSYVEVRVQLDDGVLVFFVLRDRVFATTGPAFILWLIGVTVLLGSIAIVFLRNQVRSILRLATAAEAFGRGSDELDFRPTGAMEVRRAGRAFIAMKQRIRRHIDQRTTMLAGVSHDLRTPLTRLKLSLAMEPTASDMEAMRADVKEMERMIEAYLDFAGDVAATEPPQSVNLGELVRESAHGVSEADRERISFVSTEPIELEARRTSLKRAIDNLLGNALKYGERVWVNVKREGVHAEIVVDDDGPGIPEEHRETAFKPFERLDNARGQSTPGVGLGLAVVRDAARSHGGEAALSEAPQGGLRATLRLPA
ncbi:MAG: ATP-binding protein [Pseudomonadota bacterium]